MTLETHNTATPKTKTQGGFYRPIPLYHGAGMSLLARAMAKIVKQRSHTRHGYSNGACLFRKVHNRAAINQCE